MMAPSRKPPNLTASTLPNLYALIKGSARIVMANTPLVLLRGGR